MRKPWTYQTHDCWNYRNDSVVRIYRLAIWRWWWIWSRTVKPPRDDGPQVHSAGEEAAYMRQHPEVWPLKDEYTDVYAEHHYKPNAGAADWGKEMKDADEG